MQQWIPKGHTLEPKIWGEIGLRQGAYAGVGIFVGVLLSLVLGHFGLWARIGGLALPPCLGLIVGFLRIKALAPETYLFRRVRFRLCRANTLGVWDVPIAPGSPEQISLGMIRKAGSKMAQEASPQPAPAQRMPSGAPPTRAAPGRKTLAPAEYLAEAGAFGLWFTLAALALAVAVLAYALRGALP